MKKLFFFFILCKTIFPSNTFAQSIDVKWSEPLEFNNKTGHFSKIVGENLNYVYVIVNSYFFNTSEEKLVTLIAYDNKTMKQIAERVLYEAKPDFDDVVKSPYYKTLIYENGICVLWLSDNKGGERQMDATSFDNKLNLLKERTKIYSGQVRTKKNKIRDFAFTNLSTNQLVVGQLRLSPELEFSIDYKLLDNKEFSTITSNKSIAPIEAGEKIDDFDDINYQLGNDGNIHLSYFINSNTDVTFQLEKSNTLSKRYPVYNYIDISTGKLTPFSFRYEHKEILNLNFLVTKDQIRFYGPYTNLKEGKKEELIKGIFYMALNPKNIKHTTDFKFISFNENQLQDEKMYQYQVELASDDDTNTFLFCTKTSDGNDGAPYCKKGDITILKINSNASIQWSTTIERSAFYRSQFGVKDISAKQIGNVLYVLFDSGESHPYALVDVGTGKYNRTAYDYPPNNLYEKKLRTNERVYLTSGSYLSSVIHVDPWTHNKEIVFLGKVIYN